MSAELHIGQEETDERRRILERGQDSIPATGSVLQEVAAELARARRRFAPMHSAHEGHSVIREEFEELWRHVCADTGESAEARAEAIQLAAMAVRYVVDVCGAQS
jgi:hypothetical protein